MAFWGIEVKPTKPFTHIGDSRRRLHISQATLGVGTDMVKCKCMLQCNVGKRAPIFLCSMLPDKFESFQLNLEFEEAEEVVFSVIGSCSVHLSGYYLDRVHRYNSDADSESFGEDIADTEAEQSSGGSDEDQYEDSFINDGDPQTVTPSISSDEDRRKPKDDRENQKKLIMKNKRKKTSVSKKSVEQGSSKIEEGKNATPPVEKRIKEARNGLSMSERKNNAALEGKRKRPDGYHISSENGVNIKKEREEKPTEMQAPQSFGEDDFFSGSILKWDNGKKNEIAMNKVEQNLAEMNEDHQKTASVVRVHERDDESDHKKKKKKKKKKISRIQEDANSMDEGNKCSTDSHGSMDRDKSPPQNSSNGLGIEDLKIGRPDGKFAAEGKRIHIHYTARLMKNSHVFATTIDGLPMKFRLGTENVVQGWNVGLQGMRVGGQRRLTVPPSMGYGREGCDRGVPPNSWLIYDVELLKVK